jgi:prepilin signal peptidase PulO-like enzyme (type II secretory pathway)
MYACQSQFYAILLIALFFGLGIGSFLNAYIWRLKNNKSVWLGRSICPSCKHELGAADLIPIASYILLGGRCRYCRKKISWQYPVVEIVTGLLFTAVALKYGADISNWTLILRDWFFMAVLVIIFVYDLRWQYILDRVTLPAIVIAFCANVLIGYSWTGLILAALIGGGFFLFQFLISRGKWVGGGDIRMGALIGFMVGWPQVLVALFLAYFFGSIVAVFLLSSGRKKMGSKIAMGTFLSAAAAVTLLWGEKLISWYLGL